MGYRAARRLCKLSQDTISSLASAGANSGGDDERSRVSGGKTKDLSLIYARILRLAVSSFRNSISPFFAHARSSAVGIISQRGPSANGYSRG